MVDLVESSRETTNPSRQDGTKISPNIWIFIESVIVEKFDETVSKNTFWERGLALEPKVFVLGQIFPFLFIFKRRSVNCEISSNQRQHLSPLSGLYWELSRIFFCLQMDVLEILQLSGPVNWICLKWNKKLKAMDQRVFCVWINYA